MKITLPIFIYLMGIFMVSGCTTVEKFNVSAPAGTKITLPMDGIVEPQSNNGVSKITIPSEGYCGYVLATPPESTTPIPMGLDLKKNKHQGTKAMLGVGYAFAGIGGVGAIGSLIPIIAGAANGDDDVSSVGGVILGVSGALAGAGAALGMPAQDRMRQTAYDYSFGYENYQQLDIPQLSAILLHPNPEKNATEAKEETKSTRKKATSGQTETFTSSKGSKVKKSRTALSNKVAGRYIGTGQLLLNRNQEEYYSNVELEITPIDKNSVKVRIVEDGEDFFEEPLIYTVDTDKKGNYQLKIDKIVGAVITITKSSALSFTHPKVNIDDTMYNLVIKAAKDR